MLYTIYQFDRENFIFIFFKFFQRLHHAERLGDLAHRLFHRIPGPLPGPVPARACTLRCARVPSQRAGAAGGRPRRALHVILKNYYFSKVKKIGK